MYRKELFKKAAGVTIACLLTIALNATLSDKNDQVSKSADAAKTVVISSEDGEEPVVVPAAIDNEVSDVTTETLSDVQESPEENQGQESSQAQEENQEQEQASVENQEQVQAQNQEQNQVQDAEQFQDTAISIANDYVNIRKEPNTDSDIKGKLYQGSAATILKTKGDWVKIKSGSVTGYIRKDYLAIGTEAAKLADKYGKLYATVKKGTDTLNVRREKSTEADILAQLDDGDSRLVKGEAAEWVKIKTDDGLGYVAKEYVTTKFQFEKAVSIQEEQASDGSTASSQNDSIVSYALQFVGNPYVWGGTSLTNGADCSGFTMSVYAHFGYGLPHSSAAQAGCGRAVSMGELQPGDLVFYRHGESIGHVAMYIGGGRVVHAQCVKTGITTSDVYYNTPACARRIIG